MELMKVMKHLVLYDWENGYGRPLVEVYILVGMIVVQGKLENKFYVSKDPQGVKGLDQ